MMWTGRSSPPSRYEGDTSAWPGNARSWSGDPDIAIDTRNTGSALDFNSCPHIDVDPNIGLMLVLGLTNKLTVRKNLLSRDSPAIVGKYTAHTSEIGLLDAIEQARKDGKSKLMVVLKFPKTQRGGATFNRVHGRMNEGNCEHIPVIIDIRPESMQPWKADSLRTEKSKKNTYKDELGEISQADARAQECGFADARSMQNSKPLGLNNFWLRNQEAVLENRSESLSERTRERNKLISEIGREKEAISHLNAKIAKPLPTQEEMAIAASKAYDLEKDLDYLRSEKAIASRDRESAIALRRGLLRGEDDSPEALEEMNRIKTGANDDVRTANSLYGVKLREYKAALQCTEKFILKKREAWQTIIEYKQEKIARLDQLLFECEAQIQELQAPQENKHIYAETDRNPLLLTMTVLAANVRDVSKFVQTARNDAKKGNKEGALPGKIKAIQHMYARLYRRINEDSPNGWLADALSDKPENYYLRSTRRYFEMMFGDVKRSGMLYSDFGQFAADVRSPLGDALVKFREHAITAEARAAARARSSARTK